MNRSALVKIAVVSLPFLVAGLIGAATGEAGMNPLSQEVVDIDFTRMNQVMRATYAYRLGACPQEFEGKTLRMAGVFLVREEEDGGGVRRYFGCLVGEESGCACCSAGGVLEFEPKVSYVWPTDFPPVETRIIVTGRLKMFKGEYADMPRADCTIPRLVDADIEVRRK